MRLADAACVIRSQVRAFSVSVLIGNKSRTAFRAMAHDTAHDQYRQFFARVLGSARRPRRPHVSIKLRRQVREGARPTRPAEVTNGELPTPIRPFQRRRLGNVHQKRSRVDPFKHVRTSQAFEFRTIGSGPWPHLMMPSNLAPTRTTTIAACDSLT